MAPPPRESHNIISNFIQSTATNLTSLLTSHKPQTPNTTTTTTTTSVSPFKIFIPVPIPASESHKPVRKPRTPSPGSGPPSSVRINSPDGPGFSGQVFSLCDVTGTGLLAVTTHFDIPFISQRTPEWIKKMFSNIIKNESGPIFRFFMDLGDAVTYIQRLNIPNGVVGACRLDSAYEHFKENPHLFQFVPNSKQVKAAKNLLKGNKKTGGGRIDGVPVFTAQNVDFAVATPEGIKWYTPYFFDKNFLDSILEDSTDQHFDALIKSRRVQRRGDVVDDNFASEIIEESADSIWEPGEVQDIMDEIGQSGIPLSVITKAAELQFSYAIDKMLLGNRWLRKATGIQPKFPYYVDSFERRSAVSRSRAIKTRSTNSDAEGLNELPEQSASAQLGPENEEQAMFLPADLQSSKNDWLRQPWSKPYSEPKKEADSRVDLSGGYTKEEPENPLLPRITFFGVEATESGRMTKANVRKTMEMINEQMDEEMNKELEQQGHENSVCKSSRKYNHDDRDPFFVATFGDYFSNMGRTQSPRRRLGIRR